jgi:hypothetical protein
MTRARDVADTQENNGGGVAPFVAGKNKIINGDFFVNQRNFSTTSTSNTYGFDRWFIGFSGGTVTYSAQTFTLGSAPVAGYEGTNFARVVTASQSAAGDFAYLQQRMENVKTFAGQTVTVSFWAKAATGTPSVGVVLEQQFGTGGSSTVVTSGGTTAITTSWARYSKTISVPSLSGKTIGTGTVALNLGLMTSVGTTISAAGYPAVGIQNATIDFWGIQLEAGNVATPFTTATGTIQGELAACQRYYYRTSPTASGSPVTTNGGIITTTIAQVYVPLPVTMRANPSAMEYSAINWYNYGNNTEYNTGTFALTAATPNLASVRYTHGTAIFTAGQVGAFTTAGSSSYLGFTAEL